MPSIRERKMVGQEGEPQCAGQRPQKFVEIPTRRNSTPWRILATTSTIQLILATTSTIQLEIAAVKSSLLIQYIHIMFCESMQLRGFDFASATSADRFQVWLGPLRGSHGNKLVGLFHILFTEDVLQVASVCQCFGRPFCFRGFY